MVGDKDRTLIVPVERVGWEKKRAQGPRLHEVSRKTLLLMTWQGREFRSLLVFEDPSRKIYMYAIIGGRRPSFCAIEVEFTIYNIGLCFTW